ncbi:Transcription elongation factor SPT5, partial [Frankliniella fusca]
VTCTTILTCFLWPAAPVVEPVASPSPPCSCAPWDEDGDVPRAAPAPAPGAASSTEWQTPRSSVRLWRSPWRPAASAPVLYEGGAPAPCPSSAMEGISEDRLGSSRTSCRKDVLVWLKLYWRALSRLYQCRCCVTQGGNLQRVWDRSAAGKERRQRVRASVLEGKHTEYPMEIPSSRIFSTVGLLYTWFNSAGPFQLSTRSWVPTTSAQAAFLMSRRELSTQLSTRDTGEAHSPVPLFVWKKSTSTFAMEENKFVGTYISKSIPTAN